MSSLPIWIVPCGDSVEHSEAPNHSNTCTPSENKTKINKLLK
jgi:hypothetical protein